MALKQQQNSSRVQVGVDFPKLPVAPLIRTEMDRSKHQQAMDQWYYDLKQSILAKLNGLADEITQLKNS